MMKKYPKIYALGNDENRDIFAYEQDEIIIEEKVDGGNGSFWLDDKDGTIHYGTRNRDLVTDDDKKTFAGQRAYLEKLLKSKTIDPSYVYYHEWMQRHTIPYTDAPDVIGLDIRLRQSMGKDSTHGLFLNRDAKEVEFKRLGIEVVPLVWRGLIKDMKNKEVKEFIGKSKYYAGNMEGIVLKNYNRMSTQGNHQIFAKVVTDNFKENNRAVFGSVKQKNTDTEKIVEEYCTEARIRKQVLRFVNEENEKLELQLMSKVPRAVIIDILSEETTALFDTYKFIDFSLMKRMVAKQCLGMIKEMMMESVE